MIFPNRYWLFVSDKHDQRTGIADLQSTHKTIDKAKAAALDIVDGDLEYFQVSTMQIVDTHTGEAFMDFEILGI